jgi:hypothetical protein
LFGSGEIEAISDVPDRREGLVGVWTGWMVARDTELPYNVGLFIMTSEEKVLI